MGSSYKSKNKASAAETVQPRRNVSDQILEYIIQEGLGIGDKLPAEQALAERFGVSRVCIREGIQGLKYVGILSAATRGGTTIRKLDFSQLGRSVSFQIAISHVEWRYLVEARFAIERAVLEHLAGRLTPEQLKELRGFANCRLDAATKEELLKSNVRDQIFHLRLAEATGNPVFIAYQSLLKCFFERNSAFTLNTTAEPSQEHLRILDALEENNLDLACGLLRHHLNRYTILLPPEK